MRPFLSWLPLYLGLLTVGQNAIAQPAGGTQHEMPGMAMPGQSHPQSDGQTRSDGQSQKDGAGTQPTPDSKADLMAGMAKMNQKMSAAPMTGNTDQDFVAMMIPHHQGAVDMCEAEVKSGKDPTLKELCHSIIANQMKEIVTMQAWQRRHLQTH